MILNIPSYFGGKDFWKAARYTNSCEVQSDDKLLEVKKSALRQNADASQVVAIYGVLHLVTTRLPSALRLRKHRLAQCRSLKIVVRGDEPVPVQVRLSSCPVH